MIVLGILLFIVLVVGSQHAKKQAAKKRYVPQRKHASVSVVKAMPQGPAEPKPDLVTLSLVEKHFGTAWQKFLTGQPFQLNISNPYIRHTVALCYEQLSSAEFLNLLQVFVSPIDRQDDYSLLHNGVYRLARSTRFVESDILRLLRDLPEQYRILHIQAAVAPPLVATLATMNELEQVQDVLMMEAAIKTNDEEQTSEVDVPASAKPIRNEKESGSELLRMLKGLPSEYRAHRVQIVGGNPIAPTVEDGVIDIDTTVKPIRYADDPFMVPVWSHQYVYSAGELRQASPHSRHFIRVTRQTF